MIIHIRGLDIDLDNEIDLYFLHERVMYDKVKQFRIFIRYRHLY